MWMNQGRSSRAERLTTKTPVPLDSTSKSTLRPHRRAALITLAGWNGIVEIPRR
jgi:hypothetical protein